MIFSSSQKRNWLICFTSACASAPIGISFGFNTFHPSGTRGERKHTRFTRARRTKRPAMAGRVVRPVGIEPTSQPPQGRILSIELWAHTVNTESRIAKISLKIKHNRWYIACRMVAQKLIAALLPFTFLGFPMMQEVVPPQVHGIYLNSQTAGSSNLDALLDEFTAVSGNTVIFDVQDSRGHIAYPSAVPVSLEIGNFKNQIKDLPALVQHLHDKGFYVVARYVLFKNQFLAAKKPEFLLRKRGTQSPFNGRDGLVWLDPGNYELRQYLIAVGAEIAAAGVDEIQFDYVRFPEAGKGGAIGYGFTGDDIFTRDQAITDFIAESAFVLRKYGVKIGVDVFGIVVWDNVSWKVIGQNVAELAKYVDAIYPMPYPSHFGRGWGGHKNPADEPYFFVQETTKKFAEKTAGTGVSIRPWLQGFAMNVTQYGPNYIREQVRALKDIGLEEYAVWNSANNYGVSFKGLKSN